MEFNTGTATEQGMAEGVIIVAFLLVAFAIIASAGFVAAIALGV